jgi:hypothetical protein
MATDIAIAARRAYEIARAKRGALLGAAYAAVIGGIAFFVVGSAALAWLPLVFVVAAFSEWWGRMLARGARRGFIAGAFMLLLPLTILRPCCKPGMVMSADGSCCTMPEVCVLTGALFGLLSVVLLPRARGAMQTAEAAAGMAAGTIAGAALRCAPLFIGESLGLLGGLALGLLIAGVARGTFARRLSH